MFEKIDSLDTVTRGLPWTKRRALIRYRCHLATLARLSVAETYKSQIAWVHNLSAKGIALLLDRALEAGTAVELELKATENRLFTLTARVVHATNRPDGNWIVGCEFNQELSDADVESLL